MNVEKLNILIIDDDPFFRSILYNILKDKTNALTVESPSEAFHILSKTPIDIIICDYLMSEMNGLDILDVVKKDYPSIDFIMISGSSDMEVVIHALRKGALDFFVKPVSVNDIWVAIERTRKYIELKNENTSLKYLVNKKNDLSIIGSSNKIKEVKERIEMVSQTPDTSVLIIGESGTGKELVARGIHNLSTRKNKLFGAINMSAVPESLFESEFFGYKKGSFTGAATDKQGWLEVAHNGTLFLDEIGDMPMPLQIKLLRVLEERKFNKIGSQQQESFDVRVISATNRKIDILSSNTKEFRLDLFYRLGTFVIDVPPLRERMEDIYELSEYFLFIINQKLGKKVTSINKDVYDIFNNYNFPGNIRELKNLIEHAIIVCKSDELNSSHFSSIKPSILTPDKEIYNLEEIEKNTIIKALQKVNYNKSEASKILNIEWNALHRRMLKYKI